MNVTTNDPLVGKRLGGRVEIRAPLGAGGMGRVYRGWHLATNTQVAVKVLAPRPDQSAMAKRLNVEVVAARRLKHPNVVQVLEAGVDPIDNVLYVVMEYVEGKDLGYLLRDGKRLPAPRACAILREVLDALEEAHGLNVLHRDIKPGNIMLTRSREPDGSYSDHVKVVDFGLAKLSGELTSLTETGFVAGTPGFMAPEQAMGDDLDGRADVYACGATLYRMLSGQMPFKGEKLAAVLRAMKEDPPPIQGLAPDLDRVLRWSLARERTARCPSARAFADALAPFAEGAPAPRRPAAVGPAPQGLRLDAALGLSPAGDPPPPTAQTPSKQPTVNERTPQAIPEARAFLVTPQPQPAAQEPWRTWLSLAAVLVLGLAVGAYGTVLFLDSRREAVLDELAQHLAFGRVNEAEQGLFQQVERLAGDKGAARLAVRILDLRRADPVFPYDSTYRLSPAAFEGQTNGHPFRLEIAQATGWTFQGTLEWLGEGMTVEAMGVWQGNELLFVDTRALKGSMPRYVFNEPKLAFIVKAGKEVHLVGYDGPKQRPLQAVRRSGGPAPLAEEPTWAQGAELSEESLRVYFGYRARVAQLEVDAAERLDRFADTTATSDQLEEAQEELRERKRRLEAEPPLPREQVKALDEIIEALFRRTMVDGKPFMVPSRDARRLMELRARYGPLVDRIAARQSEIFTAPPAPDRRP